MENSIRHEGIVESVTDDSVRVKIVQTSACAGCKVASHCSTAEAKEKVIDVLGVSDTSRWKVGDSVVVTTQSTMAGKALMLGFGLPLMLMLVAFAVTRAAGGSEGLAALIMLGSLIPYYICIWACRKHISKSISFRIED